MPDSGVFKISKRGPNVRWPLVLTQGGPNQVFQFFCYVKKKFFGQRGGHGRFGQGVNTPLVPDDSVLAFKCQTGLVPSYLASSGSMSSLTFPGCVYLRPGNTNTILFPQTMTKLIRPEVSFTPARLYGIIFPVLF